MRSRVARWQYLWPLLAAVGIILLCWLLARVSANALVSHRMSRSLVEERDLSNRLSDNVARNIDQDMLMVRGIPSLLAHIEQIRNGLARVSTRGLAHLSPQAARNRLLDDPDLASLNQLVYSAQVYFGVAHVWLDTPDGYCVASSDYYEPKTVIGTRHLDRDYLRAALQGRRGQQYGVGRISGTPGIFLSSPVYRNGDIVGVIVVKLGLAQMAHWVNTGKSFIVDPNGVIILANDPNFVDKALPGAKVLSMTVWQRADLYQRTTFASLPLAPYRVPLPAAVQKLLPADDHAPLVTLGRDGPPNLLKITSVLDGGLSVYTVTPTPDLETFQTERRRYTFLLSALLVSLCAVATLLVLYLSRGRRHLAATLALNATLEHEAKYDALTGSLTRRHFLKRLRQEMAGTSHRAALVLVDLDHFKQINDTWGHAAGDTVLAAFVRLCCNTLRGEDICGRIGGEEFGIILGNSDETIALAAAERLREAVCQMSVPTAEGAIQFTISAGVAELIAGDDDKHWLHRADAALYRAKSLGRNRCVRYADIA